MGRWGDGEMGRWGDGEMGRWGDGEMGRWGDGEMGKGVKKKQQARTWPAVKKKFLSSTIFIIQPVNCNNQ